MVSIPDCRSGVAGSSPVGAAKKENKMQFPKLYVFYVIFEDEEGPYPRFLCYTKDPGSDDVSIGAFNLDTEGNYYNEIIVTSIKDPSEFKDGAIGWLEWLKKREYWVMSEDFDFPVEEVMLCEYVYNLNVTQETNTNLPMFKGERRINGSSHL